ncbi:diacylglycerol/lipid kinase family protein [Flavisolibacter ginsenosidimutans]|uniref:Diacylglycerol kinase family lipid kinase n=1 Tax=Flavisolibacter ginsenosidimutans TaxID=661481 RepID=A0A5B8UH22_9BACT|nr:diacylglycerol kinase family protein [Flavisolibacter ginsenosidimutans]QEC55360.1 diacylglycerol kinase family lipid kinase [Flavisolibacter ginsenosidimutans]
MHNNQTLLFVINPVSGGHEKKNWEKLIREAVKEPSINVDFYVQTGSNDKQAIQQRIEETKPTKVVAVGGDGTVKMVAEIVKESLVILGIVPAGSANGLARELDIPADLNEALNIILSGKEGKLDAIRINEEELCFHLSDAGLNALLVKYFGTYKGRGMWGYGRSLFKMFWNRRIMRVTVETDTDKVKRKAFMVALANAEKYGTGAVINPGGNVADGEFEIVVVRKIKLLEIMRAVTAHRNFNPKNIELFRTKKVVLTFQQKVPFQVDGEYRGKIAKIEARILPGIVNVMLPAPSSPKEEAAGA